MDDQGRHHRRALRSRSSSPAPIDPSGSRSPPAVLVRHDPAVRVLLRRPQGFVLVNNYAERDAIYDSFQKDRVLLSGIRPIKIDGGGFHEIEFDINNNANSRIY